MIYVLYYNIFFFLDLKTFIWNVSSYNAKFKRRTIVSIKMETLNIKCKLIRLLQKSNDIMEEIL